MKTKPIEPWIETYRGVKFYFLDPQPDMINIYDIAHSLSRQCRFSGHTKRFYSVAEHSVNVTREIMTIGATKQVLLQGLMHDASEAYLLDVPSPVKQYLTNYKEMEDRIMQAIFTRFSIPYPLDPLVKDADAVMLKREARDLLPSRGESWVNDYPTPWESESPVRGFESNIAYDNFLTWFDFLTKERNVNVA